MDNLLAARAQMGTSLAFHIVFSVLGVGLPLILCIAEGLALRYKDGAWMALARQWTKAFAIVFAIGAVSGAIVEFELSLLWPTFIRFSGSIIGLPFANARSLEQIQPTKYAAMEGILRSGRGEPLYIGGLVDAQTGKVYYAIEIPHGESLLAHFDLNSPSRGLDSFPVDDRPDPLPVHLSFDGMVACGFFAFFVGIAFWLLFFKRKRSVPERRWLLWGVAIASPPTTMWEFLVSAANRLIIIFFVALFVLMLVVAKPRPADTPPQAGQASAPVQKNRLAYGLLATLLVAFLVLTVLLERDHAHVGSTS